MFRNLSLQTAIGLGALLIVGLFSSRLLLRSRRKRKITRIIETIEELQRSTVKMRDPNLIEEKICHLIKGGQAKLQVISDFDFTLTRFQLNGKRCHSCHAAIETNNRLPASYRKKAKAFAEKYYPIEIDPHLSIDQKVPLMVEWWSCCHAALCETHLKQSDLCTIISESSIFLRDGCQTLLQVLHEHGVLLTIFSGGIGNVLEEVIQQQACMYDNIHIMANYMTFDDNGILKGFSPDLIHSCNKNSTALIKLPCYEECMDRPNILLLGDSLGDVSMDRGLPFVESALKIGFLNDHIEASLDKYLDSYDIVLVNDQTMDVVNAILRKIL